MRCDYLWEVIASVQFLQYVPMDLTPDGLTSLLLLSALAFAPSNLTDQKICCHSHYSNKDLNMIGRGISSDKENL